MGYHLATHPTAVPVMHVFKAGTLSNVLNGDLILLSHAFTCTAHKIYRLLNSTGLVL